MCKVIRRHQHILFRSASPGWSDSVAIALLHSRLNNYITKLTRFALIVKLYVHFEDIFIFWIFFNWFLVFMFDPKTFKWIHRGPVAFETIHFTLITGVIYLILITLFCFSDSSSWVSVHLSQNLTVPGSNPCQQNDSFLWPTQGKNRKSSMSRIVKSITLIDRSISSTIDSMYTHCML